MTQARMPQGEEQRTSVTEAGNQKFSDLFVSELEKPLRTNFKMREPQKRSAK